MNLKYLFIFILFFTFAHSALAVRMVPGSVPKVQPLQKADPFAAPNVSGNVQYESHTSAVITATGTRSNSVDADNSSASVEPMQNASVLSSNNKSTSIAGIYILMAFLGMAILYKLYSKYVKHDGKF